MSLYPAALQKPIPAGSNDPRITPRMVILHVRAGTGDSLYDYFNGPSGGIESHFYVRFTGVVEQYRDTDWQADANMQANDFAISVETEGLGPGTWTDAQLDAIKALILWAHETHGIPLRVPTTWDDPVGGIGWHNLYPTEWAGGPRECPGANRIEQIRTVLIPWMATNPTGTVSEEDFMSALSDAEQRQLYDWLHEARDRVMGGIPSGSAAGRTGRLLDTGDGGTLRGDTAALSGALQGQIAGLMTALQSLASGSSVDLAAVEEAAQKGAADGVASALAHVDVTITTGSDATGA